MCGMSLPYDALSRSSPAKVCAKQRRTDVSVPGRPRYSSSSKLLTIDSKPLIPNASSNVNKNWQTAANCHVCLSLLTMGDGGASGIACV